MDRTEMARARPRQNLSLGLDAESVGRLRRAVKHDLTILVTDELGASRCVDDGVGSSNALQQECPVGRLFRRE